MLILQDVISRVHMVTLDMRLSGVSDEFEKEWSEKCRELGEALKEELGISLKLSELDPNTELGPKSSEKFLALHRFVQANA